MAFKKYASGAWQDSGSAKRYASGAWQSCESVKRYVSGAWQNVWNSAVYFMKDGVYMNNAYDITGDYVAQPKVEDGERVFTNDWDYGTGEATIYIPSDSLVGKTLYVVAGSKYYSSSMYLNSGNGGYLSYDKEIGYATYVYKYSNLPSITTSKYEIRIYVDTESSVYIRDIYVA